MCENLPDETSKKVQYIVEHMGEISRRYSESFPAPEGVRGTAGLRLLIGCRIIETNTDDEPPRSVRYSSETIPIDEFLGMYDCKEKKITIFNKGIDWASKELKCNPTLLHHIVRVHDWAHAILHLGVEEEIDAKATKARFDPKVVGEIYKKQDELYENVESTLHEVLAQLLTYQFLKTSEEKASEKEPRLIVSKMIEIFVELCKRQPPEYRITSYLDVSQIRLSESIHLIRKGWLKGILDAWRTVILW